MDVSGTSVATSWPLTLNDSSYVTTRRTCSDVRAIEELPPNMFAECQTYCYSTPGTYMYGGGGQQLYPHATVNRDAYRGQATINADLDMSIARFATNQGRTVGPCDLKSFEDNGLYCTTRQDAYTADGCF